jgi:hypothetical protein
VSDWLEVNVSPLETQEKVVAALTETFALLDDCFELAPDVLQFRPGDPDAWSIREHLEHVCLANHYLLLTIAKGCAKARRRAAVEPVPERESDLSPLAPIAVPGSFEWTVPSHMIPSGKRDSLATRGELTAQCDYSLELLAGMPHGEGRLCRIRISVNSLGEQDMYQWLYFMSQHARYHLALIEERRAAAGGGAGGDSAGGKYANE